MNIKRFCKMALRDDNNLILIMEIKKYEFLYNFRLSEYSRKDLTEHAWAKISKKMKQSVNDCKEKWRNIRSTFLRSLKGPKLKRPYYLSSHLKFLLPYIKSQNSQLSNISAPARKTFSEANDSQEPGSDLQEIPFVAIGNDEESSHSSASGQECLEEASDEEEISLRNSLKYKRHLNIMPEGGIHATYSPMHLFFLSLLPDVDTLTQDQARHFRIEVLLLIEKIKNSQESPDTETIEQFFPLLSDIKTCNSPKSQS